MKSNILPVSAALATIVVAALLPISAAAAGMTATLIGLLAIACADYGRKIEPLRPDFQMAVFEPAMGKTAELVEAA
jgi:hypothetical protein